MRTQKTIGSTTYNYIWADGKLVNQSWGNNNLHFYYEQDGAVIGFDYNGEKFSYIKNLQDDIVGVIDASGNIVASYSYDTWGALLSSSGLMADINPLRYRGYYYDSETGMYYLQSRYYDPGLKRFINADVYCDTGTGLLGTNMFAYCVNNAVMNRDETGEWAEKYSGFRLSNKKSGYYTEFHVNMKIDFLSRAFCIAFATDVIARYGKWHWYGKTFGDMGIMRISVELFAHAIGYYAGKVLNALNNKWGSSWIKSGSVIDVNKNDSREWKFYAVWGAISIGKRIPIFKKYIVNRFGVAVWSLI